MEAEADMIAEPEAMDAEMEGIVAEPGVMVVEPAPGPDPDPDPGMEGPKNAGGGSAPDVMQVDDVNVTAEGGGEMEVVAPGG